MRRSLAVLILLALCGPLAAGLDAASRSRCAMCARACCCAPRAGREGCRLERPCAGERADDPAPLHRLDKVDLVSGSAEIEPPRPVSAVRPAELGRILDPVHEPLERPPRPFLPRA